MCVLAYTIRSLRLMIIPVLCVFSRSVSPHSPQVHCQLERSLLTSWLILLPIAQYLMEVASFGQSVLDARKLPHALLVVLPSAEHYELAHSRHVDRLLALPAHAVRCLRCLRCLRDCVQRDASADKLFCDVGMARKSRKDARMKLLCASWPRCCIVALCARLASACLRCSLPVTLCWSLARRSRSPSWVSRSSR